MAATYTYSQLKSSINVRIHNKMGVIADPRTAINDVVKEMLMYDLRSSKRKTVIAPNLFNDVFQYSAPSDINGIKLISIQPQTMDRENDGGFELVPEDEFDRRKDTDFNLLSFTDRDVTRRLLASVNVDDDTLIVGNLESLTGDGGTWALFGDGTNLTADSDNFVKGSASINWDISAAAGTTAGIQNSSLNTFDLTNYASGGSAFVWVYITSTTGLTNFILRLGNDSSNYYSMTATTTNESASFQTGWNLLRFDFSGKSTTGTVTATTCDYAVIYMTKLTTKVSETDYRFDHIMVKKGKIQNLIYYSRYLWQTSSGTFMAESTADTDLLNIDSDEYSLLVEKGTEILGLAAREYDDAKIARGRFINELLPQYKKMNPSEALAMTSTYYTI